MAKAIKLTDEGLKKLQDELETLKTEGRTEIAEKIKAIPAVSLSVRSTVLFTTRLCRFATATVISGISRVEIALRIAEGKNRIGSAIPFIIPNCESGFIPTAL